MAAILSYIEKESFVHKLTGTTKLIFFLFWSIAAMITYDTRVLLFMFFLGVLFLKIARLKWKEMRFAVVFMAVLIGINMVGLFVFAPEQGALIYGTRHEILHLFWRYSITLEQLFYMFNFMMKYFAVIPVALLFIMATNPSEFAASLNKIGVSYKIGYAVAIALRYIPDVQKDYREINQAQQARGVDLSHKDKLLDRMKNAATILLPLVMASLQRIETISNAMELRGFGKKKKRTWVVAKEFAIRDYCSMFFSVLILVLSVFVLIQNGGRFYNPFM